MSIKSDLTLLKTNIQNAKNKLYTNLTEKGVTTITTASTLDEMADSVSGITSGGECSGVVSSVIVSSWKIQPSELVDVYKGINNKWCWNDEQYLLYPNGDFIFNDDWNVAYYNYDNGSWEQQKTINGNDYVTKNPYTFTDYFKYKNKYKILCETYNLIGDYGIFDCYNAILNDASIYTINDINDEQIEVTVANQSFKFYDDYENVVYFYNPINDSNPDLYPILEKENYCYQFSINDNETYNFIGVNCICGGDINEDGLFIVNNNGHSAKIYAEYINFFYRYNSQYYERIGYDITSNNYGSNYSFQFKSGVNKLEIVTVPTSTTTITSLFNDTEIDYIGEYILHSGVKTFGYGSIGDVEYCTIKNIGVYNGDITYRLSSSNWGINNKYSKSRQSLIDSLITYSFDRATAGYSSCKITLSTNTKALLTESEIAAITAKGYTIA